MHNHIDQLTEVIGNFYVIPTSHFSLLEIWQSGRSSAVLKMQQIIVRNKIQKLVKNLKLWYSVVILDNLSIQDFIKIFYDIWPHGKVMDLETIFHLRNSFPPIGDQFWLRIKRIWTGNRVYNSSSYYSIVSFRIQILVPFIRQFQVDGEIKFHSLTPEIKSTFNQMWYPGENCWNIENSSILVTLKTGFVF